MGFKATTSRVQERGEPVRQRVLDAAETLLREGRAEFSMRELAATAEVSFATPFNQFGTKAAIMQALSRRRIERMSERFADAPQIANATDRIVLAVEIATQVMLTEPVVNRAVMGSIGAAGSPPGDTLALSTALWAAALGKAEGLVSARKAEALAELPGLLAFAFRGVLSFWTAGELDDDALVENARHAAVRLVDGFAR